MRGKVGRYNRRAALTPNAISLSNIEWEYVIGVGTITSAQITGVTAPITLKINIAYEPGASSVGIFRKVQSTAFTSSTISDTPATEGFTEVLDGGTFEVPADHYVAFACQADDEYNPAGTVTVKNASDGDAVLATFSFKSYFP